MNQNEIVLSFFRNEYQISNGSYHNDILKYSETEIESKHDFIQWIFPTTQKSQYNQNAPIISGMFPDLLRKDRIALTNYCRSCNFYLKYIGLNCIKRSKIIEKPKSIQLFQRPNHNLLRITRVLNSLNQVGREGCSRNLFLILEAINTANPNKISPDTYKYWELTQDK